MKKALFAFVFFLTLKGWAQQDPQFTQYMFNTFYYNPAYAGTEGATKGTLLMRTQWLGYSPSYGDGGAPVTQILSVHTPIPTIRGGVGGYIVNDQLGAVSNIEIQASYAYYLNLKNARLSIGIRGGIISQKVDFDLFRAIDSSDKLLDKAGQESQTRPDVSVGALYRKDKYSVGVGVSHLNQATYDFGLSQENQLKRHYYITGSYFYDLNFDVRIQLVGLVKSDGTKTSFDVGGLAYFKNIMWGGLSFRQSDALSLILGYSLFKDKALKIGYALDYIINDQQAKQATSHEFMLSYSIPAETSRKKVIRTPRFRY